MECQENENESRFSLVLYQVHSDSWDMLDRLDLGVGNLLTVCPRVHCRRRRVLVFVPFQNRVTAVRIERDRLVIERTLNCVQDAVRVDAKSLNTVYVSDRSSCCVHVVDVENDRITSTLHKPDTVTDGWPLGLAVLGDSVMVGYYGRLRKIFIYRHGSLAHVKEIPFPAGLTAMTAISTDRQRHFLVTDMEADMTTRAVYVMDVRGDYRHEVKVNNDSIIRIQDCAVVNRQLWVGLWDGYIVIMSSQ